MYNAPVRRFGSSPGSFSLSLLKVVGSRRPNEGRPTAY